jgi:PAS domain S-box-containing protein
MFGLPKSKAIDIVSWLCIITGAGVIVSWIFNLPSLETFFPQYVSMRFNTGICLLFTGGALKLIQAGGNKRNIYLFYFLAIAGALFAGLSLAQNIFNFNAGIDELFVKDIFAAPEKYPVPGRMAANVSFCFVAIDGALLGIAGKNRLLNQLSQYLLHVVTIIAIVAIVGYLYGISLFYTLSAIGSMAIHTAILFLFISISASLMQPPLGITGLFTGTLVGNRMAKWLFLMILLMVIVFGEIKMFTQQYNLLPAQIGFPLMGLCFLLVSLGVVAYAARWLNRIDQQRHEAEEELTVMNEELEERVQERSSELLNLLDRFRESESKFRAAFEHSGIGMALVSLSGEWLKVNERLCDLLGYSEQELLAMTMMDVTYPDDMAVSIGTLEIASAGKRNNYRIEKRFLCKDGSVIWASVNVSTVTGEQQQPLYMVSQIEDITERKKLDARFRTIVESVFVGIKLNDAEGNIIYRSPSMQAINGWTDEEMNRNYFLLAHPDDLGLIKDTHDKVLANPDKSFNIIYRILHRNGYYIWIESLLCNKLADPDLGAIITVTRDINERKLVEDQLTKSEEKYHSLVEHASDAIYLHNYAGEIIEANESMCKMTGYTREELLHMNITGLFDPEDLKTNPLYAGPWHIGKTFMRERGLMAKDGHIAEAEINLKVIADNRILVILRDIRDRKRAEELVRHEKALLETVIESLPEVFYLRDMQGHILRWNKNFEKVTGYSGEEVKNLISRELLAPDDKASAREQAQSLNTRGFSTIQSRVVTKDGTKIPLLIFNTAIKYENQDCVVGIAVDISERLKAEEELRVSEHKYKLLFDSNPLPMWMIGNDDLSIIAVNDAAANLYGYSKDELLHMKASGLRHPDDVAAQTGDWQKEARENDNERIIRHVKKDGSVMFVQIIAQDIVFEGRQVRLAFTNDVTEKIKAEETLRKSEANLKTIMDATDTAYVLLDRKLDIMTFNPKAVKFADSINVKNRSGLQLSDYFPKEKLAQFMSYAVEVLKGRSISYELSYPQIEGAGVSWHYIRLFPITNDKHKILGLMLAISDITERKNAEESLKTAYGLIQEHIESIREMAWKQSHLIRSPVANLKGLITMLETDHSNPDVQKFISMELDRLDKIIIEMAGDASGHD